MSELTIAQVQEKKHQLEKFIGDLLLNFSKETGVKVERVDTNVAETNAGEIVQYHVEIDTRI